MVGGVTLGYCATGKVNSATRPISTNRIASTLASTGRSMKNLAIIVRYALRHKGIGRRCRDGDRLGRHLLARHGARDPVHHHAVIGRKAGDDLAQIAEGLTGDDAALFHHIVLVQHQGIAAGLIGAERAIGHQQRLAGLQQHGDAHPGKEPRQQHMVGILEDGPHLQACRWYASICGAT